MTELRSRLARLYGGTGLTRTYTALKMLIIPFEQFASYLSQARRVLDVGCGYGYVSNYLALENDDRVVIGNDVAQERITAARKTIGNRSNIDFVAKDCRDISNDDFDGIVVVDVLHHLPYSEQIHVLADFHEKLTPGGTLVIRETDKKLRVRYFLFNYLELFYQRGVRCKFRKAGEWKAMLESVGFEVRHMIPNPPFFPYITVLLVCRRRANHEQ